MQRYEAYGKETSRIDWDTLSSDGDRLREPVRWLGSLAIVLTFLHIHLVPCQEEAIKTKHIP
jgi:hypothetical protein